VTKLVLLTVCLSGQVTFSSAQGQPRLASRSVHESSASPVIEHCLVSTVSDVQIPAQAQGVLISLQITEGVLVKPGDLLAQLDDAQAQLQKQAAQTRLRAAQQQADADIEVRYAEAAYKVARAEYEQSLEINGRVAGTVPASEVRRQQLQMHRAQLQIGKAELEGSVAKMNAEVHSAEVRAADDLIRRQRIESPLQGVVRNGLRDVGGWVDPGDRVMQVVRMEQRYVEGFVDGKLHNPQDVANRPVVVTAELARSRNVQLPGKVDFVSPVVQAGNKYRIRAVVENRLEQGQWLLRPGMIASLQIITER